MGKDIDLKNIDITSVELSERMAVPSAIDATPAYAGVRGTFAYRTQLKVTANSSRIRFHGMGMWCRVYVDGVALQECSLPYSGFWVDVPATENTVRELVVVIDNRFDYERVPLQKTYFDFYAYGGLFRSVEWHEVDGFSIDRARVEKITGGIKTEISFHGNVPANIDLKTLVNGEKEQVFESVEIKNNTATLCIDAGALEEWNPEKPVLHTLQIFTGNDDIIERFGLRDLKIENRQILLNGKPQKLLGYNRHESHPQFGPALPDQLLISDLQILKDMGCNFVRGSHYPQDQRFLDLCDEMGFLVFEEALGWQDDEKDFVNPQFVEQQELQTRLMVRNSINHPSIIMWGFLNEGYSNLESSRAVYTRLATSIREEDSSRFVTFASNQNEEELNFDLADIISVNTYPGWYGELDEPESVNEIVPHIERILGYLKDKGQDSKPFIISEIGAGAIYGWRDAHQTHWSEEYQAEYLETICKIVVGNEQITGVALWQFCDGRTYGSSRALMRPRAFNNKGTLDEYRRPKMAYQRVKEIFTSSR